MHCVTILYRISPTKVCNFLNTEKLQDNISMVKNMVQDYLLPQNNVLFSRHQENMSV